MSTICGSVSAASAVDDLGVVDEPRQDQAEDDEQDREDRAGADERGPPAGHRRRRSGLASAPAAIVGSSPSTAPLRLPARPRPPARPVRRPGRVRRARRIAVARRRRHRVVSCLHDHPRWRSSHRVRVPTRGARRPPRLHPFGPGRFGTPAATLARMKRRLLFLRRGRDRGDGRRPTAGPRPGPRRPGHRPGQRPSPSRRRSAGRRPGARLSLDFEPGRRDALGPPDRRRRVLPARCSRTSRPRRPTSTS